MIEEIRNWGAFLITYFLHPLTIIATPTFLFFLIVYFIVKAFRVNKQAGIRSLSGALLPLIIMTFISLFDKDLLITLGDINALYGYIGSLIWGIIIMLVMRYLGSISSLFPSSEIILSGSFNILVFSYVHIDRTESNILTLYYGVISGFLLYIILFGFPLINKKTNAV